MKQILKLVITVCTKGINVPYQQSSLSRNLPSEHAGAVDSSQVSVFLTRMLIRVLGFGPAQTQPYNISKDKV